jgi:hypothetical protein
MVIEREGKMERGERRKDSGGDGKGGGEVGDDLEGWYSERRIRMVVNAYTEAAIIDEGAMTSAKSPSLRF